MKNSLLTSIAILLLSPIASGQNCQDNSLPNLPVPGFISTMQANYGDEAVGQIYNFDLKPFSKLSDHHVILKFDLAYTYFPGRYDSLMIMVSSNGGQRWETLLYAGGEELSTSSPSADYFIPNRSEWQSYQFDLYRFSGPILIRFRFINGNGNNLYLDNLGFQEGLSAEDDPLEMKSSVYPNPVQDSGLLGFDHSVNINNATILIIDSWGREIERLHDAYGEQFQSEAINLNPGLYYYQLQMHGQTKSHGQFTVVH